MTQVLYAVLPLLLGGGVATIVAAYFGFKRDSRSAALAELDKSLQFYVEEVGRLRKHVGDLEARLEVVEQENRALRRNEGGGR